MSVFVIRLYAIFALSCVGHGARILGIFNAPTYSHFQLGDRIFRELAARDHEVTVISPFELKNPVKNLKHVVLTGYMDKLEEIRSQMFAQQDLSVIGKIIFLDMIGHSLTEATLNHPNVQALLNSDAKFDLVIHEWFVNEALSGFAEFYQTPRVIISSQGGTQLLNEKMGNPCNPAYVPDFFLGFKKDMNFFQRVKNTLFYVGLQFYIHLVSLPRQNSLFQKYFPGVGELRQLYYNNSLMLLNSHASTHHPMPLVPNMIEIGGYHLQPSKPLPADLEEYLDSANNGAIYFSMGSNLRSRDMPEETRKIILKVLGKLKQNVLWKWEDDVLPGQPPNVKLGKWFPQQDILAHPNIKLFITHGGMLSTIETVYHGVPILGLPVYGDQETNMANAESAGYGISIPFKKINEATLTSAIEEILNNPKYTENVKARSKVMLDRPIKPLDTAIYWIEYVLRHKGAPHLQTAALKLDWYQYLLLDVVLFVVFIIAAIFYILYKLGRFLLCRRRCKTVDKKKKKKKN